MKRTLEEILDKCAKEKKEKLDDSKYVCEKTSKELLRRWCKKIMYLKVQGAYISCLRKGVDQCKTEKCKDSVHEQVRLAVLQLLEKERTAHKS